MAHFQFDEGTHTYALPGSRHVPSVTQVLEGTGMAPDFSFLPDYYLHRGQAIHKAMALHLLGTLEQETLDERIRPFVEAGQEWLELVEARPIVIEHRWVHTVLEYGGTLDLFADTKLGHLIVDWKASIMDEAYEVQVAGGYAPLLLEAAEHGAINAEPELVAAARMAVVTLKGRAKPHFVPAHNNAGLAQTAVFRAALTVAKWRQAHRRF
ncbi:hypothetical protein LCGC14_0567870 [marine sediment metagenome]|uniref:PD-(D/E)XK endonuclease-like domain-containing protein n=1 Tax=marine sediment metagenome TaxID=412755 RepID=A0A0F9S3Q1_9ZZZZ